MHKHNNADSKSRSEPQVDLENQFVMRLPPEPAKVLRETLQSGLPLKDRLSVKLENDLRYGEVRFDHWLLHGRVVDLPTIIESMKTIDNKSFYKTADICQLLICKEEDDQTTTDEESQVKQKKKDPTKVDKKFLCPHGITPPLKNVRKKRFRKTLRKKYVEAPEIEKEVRRLLRNDNEAANVRWEVICEDEDQTKPNIVSSSGTVQTKRENDTSQSVDVAEHDIFGEAVSDSEDDDEDAHINVMELDENSHLSVDSRVSDSNSMQVGYSEQSVIVPSTSSDPLVTEFSKEMFESEETVEEVIDTEDVKIPKQEMLDAYEMSQSYSESQNIMTNKEFIQVRREQLQSELAKLQEQRRQQEDAIVNIENMKLRERFQEIIDNFLAQEAQKMRELSELDLEDTA
ncbi:transcription initiation factor TFIID subunit 7 [Nasonia vitripennis]|uniref:TAFII55 protein conserved region domain-containing protein n=1 Tax=Nasonia vitripennis TaxID=7425 RepID=A0A7M7GEW7_NASVI|nr:transcription initiation factor TFIID subunit 7 [Nasonia vitripennis]